MSKGPQDRTSSGAALAVIGGVRGPDRLHHTTQHHGHANLIDNDQCAPYVASFNWATSRGLELSRNSCPVLPRPRLLISRLSPIARLLPQARECCICISAAALHDGRDVVGGLICLLGIQRITRVHHRLPSYSSFVMISVHRDHHRPGDWTQLVRR